MLTKQKEKCVKEIEKCIKAYFFARKEFFCVHTFIDAFSLEIRDYCSIDLPTWNKFPHTKELLTAILSLPIDLDNLLKEIPTLLKIQDPESQEILFDHLSNLYSSLNEKSSIENTCSLWNYLKRSIVLKNSTQFKGILLKSFHFVLENQDSKVVTKNFPPLQQITDAVSNTMSQPETLISFYGFLKKFSSSLERPPSPLPLSENFSLLNEPPPLLEDINSAIDTLSSTFLSREGSKNYLRETVLFIQLFYSFQESLRNKDGDHSLTSQINYKEKHPKICEFLPKINSLIKAYQSTLHDKTKNSYDTSTILFLLESTKLSPYIYTTLSPSILIAEAHQLLKIYKNAHPVCLAYLFIQLSISIDFSKTGSCFFHDCHLTILMLASKIYDHSNFSIKEHEYMRDLFTPIHNIALIEFLAAGRNDFKSHESFDFNPIISSLLEECSLLPSDKKELQKARCAILESFSAINILEISLAKEKNNYLTMEFIHYFIHSRTIPICIYNQPRIFSPELKNLYHNYYEPFLELLTTSPKMLLLKTSFSLPKLDYEWMKLSILNPENPEYNFFLNKNYIQKVILSLPDPRNSSPLITIIKKLLLSNNFELSINELLKISFELLHPFKEIFLDAFYASILKIMTHRVKPVLLQNILFLFSQRLLLEKFPQSNTDLFFNQVDLLYRTLPIGRDQGHTKIIHTLLWSLLIDDRNKSLSIDFKSTLLHRFQLTITHPELFKPDFLKETRIILLEAINLADSDKILNPKILLELATIKEKETSLLREKLKTANEMDALFKSKIKEATKELDAKNSSLSSLKKINTELTQKIEELSKTIETQLEPFKKEIKALHKNLDKAKKSAEDASTAFLLERVTFESTLQTTQKEEVSKQAALQAAFTEKINFLETTLSSQEERVKKMNSSLIHHNPVLCPINETPIKRPCLLTPQGIEKTPGIGTALCEYLTIKDWLLRTVPETELPLYIKEDPFSILDKLLNRSLRRTLYKIDNNIAFKELFDKIQASVARLRSISSAQTSKVQSIRAEKIKMLSNTPHFESILEALGTEFIPSTAGFMLEILTTHTITIVESCCKLLLTDLDPEALSSTLTGQKVSIERSHRIVDMLRLICEKLNVLKKHKKNLKELLDVGANSVRPEYLSSTTPKAISLEEVLSGLRLSLQNSLSDNDTAASSQIQIVITWMQQLFSLTAELMELHSPTSSTKVKYIARD